MRHTSNRYAAQVAEMLQLIPYEYPVSDALFFEHLDLTFLLH